MGPGGRGPEVRPRGPSNNRDAAKFMPPGPPGATGPSTAAAATPVGVHGAFSGGVAIASPNYAVLPPTVGAQAQQEYQAQFRGASQSNAGGGGGGEVSTQLKDKLQEKFRPPTVKKQGYMMKFQKGGLGNKWKKRWFSLAEGLFLHFDDEKTATDLKGKNSTMKSAKAGAGLRTFCATINVADDALPGFDLEGKERSYRVECADTKERDSWVRCLVHNGAIDVSVSKIVKDGNLELKKKEGYYVLFADRFCQYKNKQQADLSKPISSIPLTSGTDCTALDNKGITEFSLGSGKVCVIYKASNVTERDEWVQAINATVASSMVGLFGGSLSYGMKGSAYVIPPILVDCANSIVSRGGLTSQGLFRISGNQTEIAKLKAVYQQGHCGYEPLRKGKSEDVPDVDCVAGCLKLYLRELHDCVIHPSLTVTLTVLATSKEKSKAEVASDMQMLLSSSALPELNRLTLNYVIYLLTLVAEQSSVNMVRCCSCCSRFFSFLLSCASRVLFFHGTYLATSCPWFCFVLLLYYCRPFGNRWCPRTWVLCLALASCACHRPQARCNSQSREPRLLIWEKSWNS